MIKKLKGAVSHINNNSQKNNNVEKNNQLITLEILHKAILKARVIYPKKIDCLLGSCALIFMMRRRGLFGRLLIGIQKYPFYAHAWVEFNNTILNDAEEVKNNLSIILQTQLKR